MMYGFAKERDHAEKLRREEAEAAKAAAPTAPIHSTIMIRPQVKYRVMPDDETEPDKWFQIFEH